MSGKEKEVQTEHESANQQQPTSMAEETKVDGVSKPIYRIQRQFDPTSQEFHGTMQKIRDAVRTLDLNATFGFDSNEEQIFASVFDVGVGTLLQQKEPFWIMVPGDYKYIQPKEKK